MGADVNQKSNWNARFGTPGFRSLTHVIAGLGASVVIVGALFKIEHWEGSSIMLIIGLCTEAVIFGLYPNLFMVPIDFTSNNSRSFLT